ncbi:MAG: ABC transporter ATP-binding protein [Thermonema sp.]|uniref:ABC transporter ATP-binding protein n=1 Tax=Thermonema sp. TaxID=2231181 RepID=UPI0021DEC813|nr:ABC transporter ATP-binding protein [Thermonema sp.]GIV39998.1 MAG: ABC transporter ATP-binding protein [Thermonema sp.]
MTKSVIKVENVWKQYRLGVIGATTLRDDLKRRWARLWGKEDPTLTIDQTNRLADKATEPYTWALQDINIEIEEGEVVGIIGKNGAGKSTLLKILSKITPPTKGQVKIRGRIASLLEVGTGMHPELTGIENIYLNGAILGMSRREVRQKLDDIIDFAGIAKYADTPVKRYSSGMRVRLGFAVAAFLEPDILIVDEVLAVGDAEFQKRAVGKMKEVSSGQGRTVLFVSHNMASVQTLCQRGILLDQGKVLFDGNVEKAVGYYTTSTVNLVSEYKKQQNEKNQINEVQLIDAFNHVKSSFRIDESIKIRLKFNFQDDKRADGVRVGIAVAEQRGRRVFTTEVPVSTFSRNNNGDFSVTCEIPPKLLVPGVYKVIPYLHIPNVILFSCIDDTVFFKIEEKGSSFYLYSGKDYGCVFVDCRWQDAGFL